MTSAPRPPAHPRSTKKKKERAIPIAKAAQCELFIGTPLRFVCPLSHPVSSSVQRDGRALHPFRLSATSIPTRALSDGHQRAIFFSTPVGSVYELRPRHRGDRMRKHCDI